MARSKTAICCSKLSRTATMEATTIVPDADG
jgi:hypothetical protein